MRRKSETRVRDSRPTRSHRDRDKDGYGLRSAQEPVQEPDGPVRFVVVVGIPETMDADYLRLVGTLDARLSQRKIAPENCCTLIDRLRSLKSERVETEQGGRRAYRRMAYRRIGVSEDNLRRDELPPRRWKICGGETRVTPLIVKLLPACQKSVSAYGVWKKRGSAVLDVFRKSETKIRDCRSSFRIWRQKPEFCLFAFGVRLVGAYCLWIARGEKDWQIGIIDIVSMLT